MRVWAAQLASLYPITKSAWESVQAASRKKRRKENHATAGMGGWIGQGCKADKQKDPFVFISVTFGCLAITLLHSKQRALPAEGKAKIKKKAVTAKPSVCIH